MSELPVPRAPKDRRKHAEGLKAALLDAATRAEHRRAETQISVATAEPGLYVQFDSQPGFELHLDRLEQKAKGIEVVAVTNTAKFRDSSAHSPTENTDRFTFTNSHGRATSSPSWAKYKFA